VKPAARFLLTWAACVLESGCASFVRGPPVFWSCNSQVTVGGVAGSAYSNLDPKGQQWQAGIDWEWHASDRDFRVSLLKWFAPDEVMLVANLPASLRRSRLTTELRIGALDQKQTNPALVDQSYDERQRYIRLLRGQLSQFAASRQPVYIVAVDSSGDVIRSVTLDTDALAHGEAAVALAKDRVDSMIRKYREVCSPIYAGDLDRVIT
jgi:hypothetical protein